MTYTTFRLKRHLCRQQLWSMQRSGLWYEQLGYIATWLCESEYNRHKDLWPLKIAGHVAVLLFQPKYRLDQECNPVIDQPWKVPQKCVEVELVRYITPKLFSYIIKKKIWIKVSKKHHLTVKTEALVTTPTIQTQSTCWKDYSSKCKGLLTTDCCRAKSSRSSAKPGLIDMRKNGL